MSRHVFGGLSSPSGSNYALKKTVVDNEPKFENETVNTLKRNFYVDDMLTSVPSVPEAVSLVKKVKEMRATSRFNLPKFVSSIKK